jgi:hypothetical protein
MASKKKISQSEFDRKIRILEITLPTIGGIVIAFLTSVAPILLGEGQKVVSSPVTIQSTIVPTMVPTPGSPSVTGAIPHITTNPMAAPPGSSAPSLLFFVCAAVILFIILYFAFRTAIRKHVEGTYEVEEQKSGN